MFSFALGRLGDGSCGSSWWYLAATKPLGGDIEVIFQGLYTTPSLAYVVANGKKTIFYPRLRHEDKSGISSNGKEPLQELVTKYNNTTGRSRPCDHGVDGQFQHEARTRSER